MSKKLRTLFKKTRIVCPQCGTVQKYSSYNSVICGKNLGVLYDGTLRTKNIIRITLSLFILMLVFILTQTDKRMFL